MISNPMRQPGVGGPNPNTQMNMNSGGGVGMGGMNRGFGANEQGHMGHMGPMGGNSMYGGSGGGGAMGNRMMPMNQMGQMNQVGHMGQMGPMGHPGQGMQQHPQQPPFQSSGGFGLSGMNSPSGSPRMGGPQQGLLMSPRNRGSPKMGANQFSPGGKMIKKKCFLTTVGLSDVAVVNLTTVVAGLNSPMSGIGSSGGGGGGSSTTTFSSSSLNALQAISEGVGSSLSSTLMSPSAPNKPDSSPSINSSSSSSQPSQPAKPGAEGSQSPAGGLGPRAADQHHPLHHHHHHQHPQAESSGECPDSQAAAGPKESGEGNGEATSEPPRRVPDSKGHKKLLQLLTSPTEELGIGGSGPTGPPVPSTPTSSGTTTLPESKDPSGGMTSPSSTGVSSSSSGQNTGSGGASASMSAAHYTGSLQEKHKILHKLLRNGNTPDEVAQITAEATGKASMGNQEGGEGGTGAPGTGSGPGMVTEPKQEQHSPKKEKTHALLHYLLNKDDSKEPLDVKPKLEDLEGKGVSGSSGEPPRNGPGSGPGPGPAPEHPESKIKSEPPDDVRLSLVEEHE